MIAERAVVAPPRRSESTTTFAIDDSLMAEDVPEPATKVLNEAVGGAASMGQLVRALVYYAEYDAFMPVDVS